MADIFSISCLKKCLTLPRFNTLIEAGEDTYLIFQWHVRHAIHVFFFEDESADSDYAKGAEEKQQSAYAKPLNSFDRLKQILVH
ncbi:MAG: hypothetical protein JNN28_08050 [Saprospiraceae bacterium]|nr:hypothetical protein [Saprospiraceae bacterium]